MSRWLAGSLRHSRAALEALVGEASRGSTRVGPLGLAWSGPAPGRFGTARCLLDGRVHGLSALRESLGVSPDVGPEAILAAGYRRHGEALLPGLRGDFVLVLWDVHTETAVVARDQLGARPLFVYGSGEPIAFASEVRQLLHLLTSRPAPRPAAVQAWLRSGAPAPGTTLYEGVEPLAPAGRLRLDGGRLDRGRYWWPRYREPLPMSRAEAVEAIREGARAAVGRALDGHRKVGVLLSGGLDSGSVASLAEPLARRAGIELTAYSAVFPDHPELDESALIQLQARRLGLGGVHRAVRGGSPLRAALSFLREWELPPGPPAHFVWAPLVRLAAQHGCTCLVDGEGGDELFGAAQHLMADRLLQGRPLTALRLARASPGIGHGAGPRLLAETVRDFGLAPLGAALRRRDAPLWWRRLAESVIASPDALGLFDYYRRRGEAAGVAPRHPFLDLELIELVLRIPPELAFDPVFTRPLLREAMAGLVPDEVRLRRGKSYFDRLLRDALVERDLPLARTLLAGAAEVQAYADPGRAVGLLRDGGEARHPRGSVGWTRDVWRLLTAECWLRMQSNRDVIERLVAPRSRIPRFSSMATAGYT